MKQIDYVEENEKTKDSKGGNSIINIVNESVDREDSTVKNDSLTRAKIGFDKIFRNDKNILSNTFHGVEIESNFFKPTMDKNKDESVLDKPERKLEKNMKNCSNIGGDKDNCITFEEVLMKNAKNLNRYKTEGCLVVYDERQEHQKNNKIEFHELLNILANDPSSTENFIDGSKGKWVDEFVNEKDKISNVKYNKNIDQVNFIEFESRFESGNLRMAIQVDHNEYDLILRNDINSEKTSNWFYFEIKLLAMNNITINNSIAFSNSCENKSKIKFNIINLQKKDTLFSKGLRVLKYSAESKKWARDTYDVYYYQNGISIIENKSFYTLTFSFDYKNEYNVKAYSEQTSMISINNSEYSDDYTLNSHYVNNDSSRIFYFSYCFPYTFTNLTTYLNNIRHRDNYIKISKIGKSLTNNPLYLLSITNYESSLDIISIRPAIILTARIHPGESNSSIVIQGVIDFLISDNHIAVELRNLFIFKIVPMLNPDGVINGNYRSCVNGKDLNRMWVDPRETHCPTLFYTKEMIKNTLQSKKVYMYCDFHGHSNKNNFFIYGCPVVRNEEKTEEELLLADYLKKNNDCFDTDSCIYRITKAKIKTARAVMKNEFDIKYSYCLESSIGGITMGERMNRFFTPEDYLKIGEDFSKSILELWKRETAMTGDKFMNNLDSKFNIIDKRENVVKRKKKKSKTSDKCKIKHEKKIVKSSNKIKISENVVCLIKDDNTINKNKYKTRSVVKLSDSNKKSLSKINISTKNKENVVPIRLSVDKTYCVIKTKGEKGKENQTK